MVSAHSLREKTSDRQSPCPRALPSEDTLSWCPPCPCRILGDGPAGFGLTAEEHCLSGRLVPLDGGHLSRWVPAVPCMTVSSPLQPLPSSHRGAVGPPGEAHSRIIAGSGQWE